MTFVPAENNYGGGTASVTVNVTKAAPAITWPAPAGIVYGTALSVSQLNASTTVAGTLTYTPAIGTLLNAGPQTLTVTFSPTDTANYSSATASVTLNVAKGTPSIAWSNPAAILYGTALGAAQLNATANALGTYTYSPAAGTMLAAGSQQLSVTFTPNDAVNYTGASATRAIRVDPAPLQSRRTTRRRCSARRCQR